MSRREGQQRHVARTLDRRGQAALMARAGAGAATRKNLASIGDIPLEALDILVIGNANSVGAETANLTARDKLAPPARPTGAAWTAGTTPARSIVTH